MNSQRPLVGSHTPSSSLEALVLPPLEMMDDDVSRSFQFTTLFSWKRRSSSKRVESPAGLGSSIAKDIRDPITLSDILEGRHLPPLSLKDFEQFLCYETRSLENLYFLLWFNDYKALYERDVAARPMNCPEWDPRNSKSLLESVNRAKSTFLEPGSNFELEVAAVTRRAVLMEPYPLHPCNFAQAKREVEEALQVSFEEFVTQSYQNISHRYRIMVALFGLFLIIFSFFSLSLLLHFGQSRWLRLIDWLPLAFGIGFIGTSITGVCPLVFALSSGEMRQVRPYEQQRDGIELDLDMAVTICSATTARFEDLELGLGGQKPLPEKHIPKSARRFTATFINFPSTTTSRASSRCPSFDFDGLPTNTLSKCRPDLEPRPLDLPADHRAFNDVPCFGSVTKVLSEVTKRMQWIKIVRLVALEGTLASLITLAVMFIPEHK